MDNTYKENIKETFYDRLDELHIKFLDEYEQYIDYFGNVELIRQVFDFIKKSA